MAEVLPCADINVGILPSIDEAKVVRSMALPFHISNAIITLDFEHVRYRSKAVEV